jgi:hypothetical protein
LLSGLLVGVMLAMMLPIIMVKQHDTGLLIMHFLALSMVWIFGGSLYTVQVFSQYGAPSTGIAAIMIPASNFEKFLSALLLNLIFSIPFSFLFLKLHPFLIEYANNMAPNEYPYHPIPADALTYFTALHVVIQGAVFLGSIYFSKLAYVKTAIAFVVFYLATTALHVWQVYLLTYSPSKVVTFPFTAWKIWYFKEDKSFYIPFPEQYQQLLEVFPYLIVLVLWYIAFVRLREKQI